MSNDVIENSDVLTVDYGSSLPWSEGIPRTQGSPNGKREVNLGQLRVTKPIQKGWVDGTVFMAAVEKKPADAYLMAALLREQARIPFPKEDDRYYFFCGTEFVGGTVEDPVIKIGGIYWLRVRWIYRIHSLGSAFDDRCLSVHLV